MADWKGKVDALTVSTIIILILLMIALSAINNAYLLRGGKLAWSQILIVFGMVCLIFSFVLAIAFDLTLLANVRLSDGLFILGFVFLLAASLKLRSAFK